MVLSFRPPEDLINAYLNRPSPGQEASGAIGQALQTYIAQKQQQQQLASLDAQRKAAQFGAIAPYIPEAQIPSVAQGYGFNIPTAGSVPPTPSTGTVAGMPDATGNPVTQVPSLIDRWNQSQKPTSKAGLAKYKTDLETQKLEKDIGSGPDSLEKILAKKVGAGELTLEEAYKLKAKGSPSASGLTKPPPGFRWTAEGNLEAIPGGPAGLKIDEKNKKEEGLKNAAIAQADTVLLKVDQALGKVGGLTAGLGSKLGVIPGTSARDLEKDVNTIKANLGFSTLQEMRRNSPTGGALGQVAVQELEMLQSTVASLDTSQSPEQLRRNLGEVKKHYENWKKAAQGNGAASISGDSGVSTGMENLSEEELQAIINGQ